MVIRHAEYTRARLKQTSQRLRDLVYPETRPLDELLVSPAASSTTRSSCRGPSAPLPDALRAVNLAAALSCRALDGRSAIPTASELERSVTWPEGSQ